MLPDLLIGVEADYYRHYDGTFLNQFTGDALFIGPTLYYKLAREDVHDRGLERTGLGARYRKPASGSIWKNTRAAREAESGG